MDRRAPQAGVRRLGRFSMAALVVALVVAACGGGGGDGGGGGGSTGDTGKVIAVAQTAIGTSYIDSSVEGDTITITLTNGASTGMARLFMCAQIKGAVDQYASDYQVVMVDQDGNTLYSLSQCK
jgi:ABC-type glycerol-3-phosphate transport system substrate-binding protein